MTAGQFETLDDQAKKIALFEAKKISEKFEDLYKCELFKIGDFYVESKTCRETKIKRTLRIYNQESVPGDYYTIGEMYQLEN
jgi:hypothetical protein